MRGKEICNKEAGLDGNNESYFRDTIIQEQTSLSIKIPD